MIITHDSSIENYTDLETKAFGIQQSAYLFKVLYSSMYEDKEQVVLGELAANGLDAHTAAGTPDTPIKIALPTSLSPYLVVTDTGIGMSLETIETVFPVYGSSTKRDSNNPIGGFGYGCKSPFALSSSFTVESNHEGFKTIASCYLDEGEPKFSVFLHGPTDEPNGTEIKVPVSDETVQRRLASKAMYIFTLWDTKPLIAGFTSPIDENEYTLSNNEVYRDKEYLLLNSDALSRHPSYRRFIGYSGKQSNPTLVGVGPYMYKLPVNIELAVMELPSWTLLRDKAIARKTILLPVFNIGELELSPTRETIEDTKANLALVTERYKKICEDSVNTNDVDALTILNEITKIALEGERISDNFSWINTKDDRIINIDSDKITACVAKLLNNASPLTYTYVSQSMSDLAELAKTVKEETPVCVPDGLFTGNYLTSTYIRKRYFSDQKSLSLLGYDGVNDYGSAYTIDPYTTELRKDIYLGALLGVVPANSSRYGLTANGAVRVVDMSSTVAVSGRVVVVTAGTEFHDNVRNYTKHTGNPITVMQVRADRVDEFKSFLEKGTHGGHSTEFLGIDVTDFADVVKVSAEYKETVKARRKKRAAATKSSTPLTKRVVAPVGILYTVADELVTETEVYPVDLLNAKKWKEFDHVVVVKTLPSTELVNTNGVKGPYAKFMEKSAVLSIGSPKFGTKAVQEFLNLLSSSEVSHVKHSTNPRDRRDITSYFRDVPAIRQERMKEGKVIWVSGLIAGASTHAITRSGLYNYVVEGSNIPKLRPDVRNSAIHYNATEEQRAVFLELENQIPLLIRVILAGLNRHDTEDNRLPEVLTETQRKLLQKAIRTLLKAIDYN